MRWLHNILQLYRTVRKLWRLVSTNDSVGMANALCGMSVAYKEHHYRIALYESGLVFSKLHSSASVQGVYAALSGKHSLAYFPENCIVNPLNLALVLF